MRKLKRSKSVALLAPVLALLLAGGVIAGLGDDQNDDVMDVNIQPGGDDDECICPMYYAPVICVANSGPVIGPATYEEFTNPCFAGCAGYTRCKPAPATKH